MASKTLNKFIDLYTSMNEGKITYEEFLDLSDPKNPDGIYKDVLDKIDKAIGSKEFANIDDASRIKVLNVRTNILTKGDDPEMIGIKDNFGLDSSALASHRLLLKQGLKPVFDLTDKQDPGDILGIPYSFVRDSEINNNKDAYFHFRSYNEKGIPSEFIARGIKVDTGNSSNNKYAYPLPQYGNIFINKNKSEALVVEGLNGNGDGADINKGVINLYPQALKSVVEDTRKAIGDLKTIYSQATISAGSSFDASDGMEFDKWAYDYLQEGKTMKDLEARIYDSPQMKMFENRQISDIGSFAGQGAIVPVEVPSEPLLTGFIKMKEVPSIVKESANIGSDYFIFIILFSVIIVILLNYKYDGNKKKSR